MNGLTSDTIGCVPKLMSNEELIALGQKSVAAVEEALKDIVDTFRLNDVIPWCVLAHIDVQAEGSESYPGLLPRCSRALPEQTIATRFLILRTTKS